MLTGADLLSRADFFRTWTLWTFDRKRHLVRLGCSHRETPYRRTVAIISTSSAYA